MKEVGLTPAQKRMLTIQKKKNAEFNALPPMKKRVAVAQDVLLQLKIGKFKAGDGFGTAKMRGRKLNHYDPLDIGDLQTNLIAGMECTGCAKGACLISRARLGDKVTMEDFDSIEDRAHQVSYEIFGEECADLIEALYEGWSHPRDWSSALDEHEENAFDDYSGSLPSRRGKPRERMEAIYQNIVDNKGKLKFGKYRY
jgi:hypothetical protein